MTTVEFGGVVFDDQAFSGFTISKLVGWSDAAPSRYSAEDRPQAHGSFRPGIIYRAPRVVSVEGSWLGDTLEDAYAARELLAGVQADGVESPFTVTDLLGTRWMTAGLSTAPTMDDGLYQPFFKYAFDVIAADPFKYGQAVVTSTGLATAGAGVTFPITFPITFGAPGATGRVLTVNAGTADTFSQFTVSGGSMAGGFTLVEVATGRRIVVARDIASTDVVAINPKTGSVTLNGSPIPGYVTRSEWWPVPRGGSTEVQFLANGATTGTPTLTASTPPAYL